MTKIMIQISKIEQQWIKMCKGHYQKKYPFTGRWVNTLKPLFIEIYGYDPDADNNYNDYLNCMFNRLLDIQLKIVCGITQDCASAGFRVTK